MAQHLGRQMGFKHRAIGPLNKCRGSGKSELVPDYERSPRQNACIAAFADPRGVSAVEFALIAPLLIVIFMGLSDLTTATLAQLHVNRAAQGTADVVASQQNLTLATDMPNMFNAATYFMTPYSATPLSVLITDIYYDGTSATYGKVYWSCAMNGLGSTGSPQLTPYTWNTQFQYVPGMSGQNIENVLWTNNAAAIGTSVIVVQTSYSFSSPSSFIIKGVHTMTSSYATIPRITNYVSFPYTPGTTPPAPTSTTTANTTSFTLGSGATVNCNYGS
jgi:Flp pilus assembly protein TadG